VAHMSAKLVNMARIASVDWCGARVRRRTRIGVVHA